VPTPNRMSPAVRPDPLMPRSLTATHRTDNIRIALAIAAAAVVAATLLLVR